jgi:serine/threonine/tyrosine-interacting protein
MKSLKLNIKLTSNIPCESQSLKNSDDSKLKKMECNEILENIYLSGSQSACNYEFLLKQNFTHIVNCATGSKSFKSEYFEEIKYLLLDMKDEPGFDIIFAVYSTIDFIESALAQGGKILIHCYEVCLKS